MMVGRDKYMEENRDNLREGRITPKQYRVNREYAQMWDTHKKRFKIVPSIEETEYKNRFKSCFQNDRIKTQVNINQLIF